MEYCWQMPCLGNLDYDTLPRIHGVGGVVSCDVWNHQRLPVTFGTREIYGPLLRHLDTGEEEDE